MSNQLNFALGHGWPGTGSSNTKREIIGVVGFTCHS